jgi:hypothetical protein
MSTASDLGPAVMEQTKTLPTTTRKLMAHPNFERGLNDVRSGRDIHKSERANIFRIGALLIEAKDQCEHGQWLDWLAHEFGWSVDTTQNYMAVARLAARNRTVRNLKVPARTLYAVAHLKAAAVPDALAKLRAAAKERRVTAEQGQQIVELAESSILKKITGTQDTQDEERRKLRKSLMDRHPSYRRRLILRSRCGSAPKRPTLTCRILLKRWERCFGSARTVRLASSLTWSGMNGCARFSIS